jgi:hypothetical protein
MGAFRVFMFVITSKTGLRGFCVLAMRRRDLDNLLAVKKIPLKILHYILFENYIQYFYKILVKYILI